MQTSWIFKPKFSQDIYNKVIRRFTNYYLAWADNGIDYHYDNLKDGWVCLNAWMDSGSCEYYSETCFSDAPIPGEYLTDDMLILLVEAGVAYQREEDDDKDYYLEDVDITAVFAALAQDNTNVYAPMGAKCYVYPTNTEKSAYHADMLDSFFTL